VRRIAVAVALVGAIAAVAGAGPAEEKEYLARAAKAAKQDAQELRRVAEWGDRNGLERTADADWERVPLFRGDRGDEADGVRRRLRQARREGTVRDAASWALARAVPTPSRRRSALHAPGRSSSGLGPPSPRPRPGAAAPGSTDGGGAPAVGARTRPLTFWAHARR
jgi:hypothetical protein